MHWGTKGGKQKGKEMEGLGRGKGTEKGVPGKIEDIVEGRKEEEGGVKNFELKVKSVFLPSSRGQ